MAIFRHHTTEALERGSRRVLSVPFHSAAVAMARVRSRAATSLNASWLNAALLLSGLALGALLSSGWRAQPVAATSAPAPLTRGSSREIVAATESRLESEQSDLNKQMAGLRAQINSLKATNARREITLRNLDVEVNEQRVAAGMTAMHGMGIVATFDDSTDRAVPRNEDPANYILHEYDLRDILNALWIAGAEAASLNGERIVGNTSLYCVGSTVICNITRLSPPYEIRAIGDPQALEAALRGSRQMEKFNQRAQVYDLPVKIEQSNDVLVPAFSGPLVFKYATTGK